MRRQEGLDSSEFIRMLKAGFEELGRHKDEVNALNVFPVPDGDTGTNMYLSYSSGIEQIESLPVDSGLDRLTAAFSSGLLMGARGNSGVILSQLFRGFQLAFGSAERVDPRLLADAFRSGVQTAYRAVSRPVEGTILTVAREAAAAAEAALRSAGASIGGVLDAAIAKAEQTLARTPDMLPILRQAGVVDSGGQGLLHIYRGFRMGLTAGAGAFPVWERAAAVSPPFPYAAVDVHGDGEFGYCTEFIIHMDGKRGEEAEREIRSAMGAHGDSLLVVAAGDLVKVHIHTLHPGLALEDALEHGSLDRVKIDNMTEQHHDLVRGALTEQPTGDGPRGAAVGHRQWPAGSDRTGVKRHGLIAVVAGDGLTAVFQALGVDEIVSGGQTMNPPTEELLAATVRTGAEHVFLLPNNSNVILAAEQAATVSDGRLRVIPTRSVGEGLGAVLAFQPDADADVNERLMKEAAAKIMSGAITAAVRDTSVGGHVISEGDFVAIRGGEMAFVDAVRATVLKRLLEDLCASDAAICTVFYAREELAKEVGETFSELSGRYPDVEFEMQYGGQPIYDFLLAAE
ncbi:MAG: DAK2 domain-containing protein [Bacilli bacterium]